MDTRRSLQARPSRIPLRGSLGLALLATLLPPGLPGQDRPAEAAAWPHLDPILTAEGPFDRGVTAAALRLRGLEGIKRVLVIAAHPDDEDTALITALARGMGAEVAYLSLSRGDGGQNLIGPELGEGLGLSRTGELVAARRLDGGRQYFARAFDFGFSKTAEETFGHWPREELVRDVVWIIRRERPHVVVSIFGGTPDDGHGHHQAAGLVAREAFEAAADPDRFPDQLEAGVTPWQPSKLYRSRWFSPDRATLSVETGRYDPVLGRSHHQVAMESRSLHRSQDMGTGQPLGPRQTHLSLVQAAPGIEVGDDDGVFAGVDTTLAGRVEALPDPARGPALEAARRYRSAIAEAREGISALRPDGAVPALGEALGYLDEILRSAGGDASPDLAADLHGLRARVEGALLAAAGVTMRAVADRETVVPGESLEVTVELWNGGADPLRGVRPRLLVPQGWRATFPAAEEAWGGAGDVDLRPDGDVEPRPDGDEVPPGEVARWSFRVEIPSDASPTRPYFMVEPRDGGLFRWPDDPALHGLPWDPAPVRARVELSVGDSPRVHALRDARRVEVDKALGELIRPLRVVPALSVKASPSTLAWPLSDEGARPLSVTVEAAAPARGILRVHAPEGWRVEPGEREIAIDAAGESLFLEFRAAPTAAREGFHAFRFEAVLEDGRSFDEGYALVDHPHIEPIPLFSPAEIRVTRLPVAVREGLRVGYIQGSGDDGPEALRQMGVPVEILDLERVRAGDLDGLTTLVMGIRVYETRPEVAGVNRQILEFARGGGTVVVQYNKHEFPEADVAPYPVSMAPRASRVTNHESPVELVEPDSPLFHSPNRITEAEFEGWVQERGLYFLESWAAPFRPQLAMWDPGEDPHLGSLVVAPVGEGLYVYTGLSFFRQLPAGVPGALRLFANLVSLDPAEWPDR
jgi:LmbE family N-acetylglucosaminyl deacetylase